LPGMAAIGFEHIETGFRKKGFEIAGRSFVGDGVNKTFGRHPFLQGHFAAFEEEAKLLAIHAGRLSETVVKMDGHAVAITHDAGDLFFDSGTGPQGALGGGDAAGAEPAFKKIEEVYAVFDKNAAAFGAVPEPVVGRQIFIGGIIFKVAVKEFPEEL